jgi:peroxiredoxin
VELQARVAEFRTLGIGVVALAYDAPEAIKTFADERKIEFPILSGQDHIIVLRYGILNQ